MTNSETGDERQGVKAFETGLSVLGAFVGLEPSPMLKTLSERIGMHPAKVHRYLVSLCRMGYVEQDAASSRYRLGSAALQLGFAAVGAVDVLRVTRPLMAQIREDIGSTVLLAIWGSMGPTVALMEAGPGPITITAAVGTTLPLLRSSTGRVFAAHLPRSQTAALLKQELIKLRAQGLTDSPSSLAEMETLFEDVRNRGLARVTGQLNKAVHALSAPILDGHGTLSAVLSAVGAAGQFDASWGGATARTLAMHAVDLSAKLGHTRIPPLTP